MRPIEIYKLIVDRCVQSNEKGVNQLGMYLKDNSIKGNTIEALFGCLAVDTPYVYDLLVRYGITNSHELMALIYEGDKPAYVPEYIVTGNDKRRFYQKDYPHTIVCIGDCDVEVGAGNKVIAYDHSRLLCTEKSVCIAKGYADITLRDEASCEANGHVIGRAYGESSVSLNECDGMWIVNNQATCEAKASDKIFSHEDSVISIYNASVCYAHDYSKVTSYSSRVMAHDHVSVKGCYDMNEVIVYNGAPSIKAIDSSMVRLEGGEGCVKTFGASNVKVLKGFKGTLEAHDCSFVRNESNGMRIVPFDNSIVVDATESLTVKYGNSIIVYPCRKEVLFDRTEDKGGSACRFSDDFDGDCGNPTAKCSGDGRKLSPKAKKS